MKKHYFLHISKFIIKHFFKDSKKLSFKYHILWNLKAYLKGVENEKSFSKDFHERHMKHP